MDKVLLMSANEIKNFTNINYNVSDEYISSTIDDVQEVYLQEIIGTALLLRIKELVLNTAIFNKGDIESNEETLYNPLYENYNTFYQNFIKNYIKEKVEVELLINLNYKLRNAGVVKQNDKSVGYDDLERIIRNKETSVNHWATMLSKYLKDADFVEIKNCGCYPSWYIAPEINKNYGNIGLWLGSESDNCGC